MQHTNEHERDQLARDVDADRNDTARTQTPGVLRSGFRAGDDLAGNSPAAEPEATNMQKE